uniref:cadherin EGF LAG seven-pass G-type receptor 1 n=1 Tax=Callithrix jacchus TaxID=9483 RepID=UPI0023DD1F3C|nr:cadherin EGF LAG seven-pass G-type receptor 1 [Callithrix jacchus]
MWLQMAGFPELYGWNILHGVCEQQFFHPCSCGWTGFSTWPQVTRFHPFLRLKNILLWMYIAVSSSLHSGRTVLAVDIFDKLNFTGATVPRFDTIQEEFPRELQSSVSFPADFFKPPEEKEGPLGRPAGRRTTPQTTAQGRAPRGRLRSAGRATP